MIFRARAKKEEEGNNEEKKSKKKGKVLRKDTPKKCKKSKNKK